MENACVIWDSTLCRIVALRSTPDIWCHHNYYTHSTSEPMAYTPYPLRQKGIGSGAQATVPWYSKVEIRSQHWKHSWLHTFDFVDLSGTMLSSRTASAACSSIYWGTCKSSIWGSNSVEHPANAPSTWFLSSSVEQEDLPGFFFAGTMIGTVFWVVRIPPDFVCLCFMTTSSMPCSVAGTDSFVRRRPIKCKLKKN